MSLNIHEKCKERLVEVIADSLGKIDVKNRMFVERMSCIDLVKADSILPNSGNIKSTLQSSIGELPVFNFIFESLSRELTENFGYDSKTPISKLTDIDGYQDTTEVSRRLVDEFNSLPWRYIFSIELNSDMAKLFQESLGNFDISESMAIRKSDDNFSLIYPPMSGIEKRDESISGNGLGLLSIFTEHSWNASGAFIQIKNDGFVGQYGPAETHTQAIEKLKSFCGLGIALRLFKINAKYRSTVVVNKY
ncbi:hypothetical protein [Photobacterium sp. GB-210]|uniref:hypothetical protein n=1 Tax=Photobacterium sp. GB-210 TaxID=2022104 RepID=UPI0018EA6B86|nr:hypothetical protein [Photobacterium sp. GB-210]